MTSRKSMASIPEQTDSAFMPVVYTDRALDLMESGPSLDSENGVNPTEQVVDSPKQTTVAVVHTECTDSDLDVIDPDPSSACEKGESPSERDMVSPSRRTDSAFMPTVAHDPALDVIESDTSSESENGATLRKRCTISSAGALSDLSALAPDIDSQLAGGSDIVNEVSSEENIGQPEYLLPDVQAETSSTEAYRTRKAISAFAKAKGLCDPVRCTKTGFVMTLVALGFGATSIPLWALGAGYLSLAVFVSSLVISIIGLLVLILGLKGEESIRQFLAAHDGNEEDLARLTFRNPFYSCRGGRQQDGIGSEIIALRSLPRPPAEHHDRLKRLAEERMSYCKRSLCPTCCQEVPSDIEMESYTPSVDERDIVESVDNETKLEHTPSVDARSIQGSIDNDSKSNSTPSTEARSLPSRTEQASSPPRDSDLGGV